MDLGFLIALSLLLGLAAWLFFMWSVKSGQYEDPEGPKYRMMDDDDEAPARPAEPERPAPSSSAGRERPAPSSPADRGPGEPPEGSAR